MARILVVDDEPDIRDVVSEALERAGHDVTAADDGTSAAQLHHEHQFDMIVSDLRMPGLNGIQLVRAVRADSRCDIPFLLVTASASPQDLSDARRAGVTDVLGKPFGFTELRDKVALMLAAAQAARVGREAACVRARQGC